MQVIILFVHPFDEGVELDRTGDMQFSKGCQEVETENNCLFGFFGNNFLNNALTKKKMFKQKL